VSKPPKTTTPQIVSVAAADKLRQRKIPSQKRSEKTVTHILDISAGLLEEVGLDSFNTNLLAERADVRIATVYRYFPNKHAILSSLLQRFLEQIQKRTTLVSDLKDPSNDWRECFEAFIDTYVDIVLTNKGHLAIRRAALAAPEVRHIEAKIIRLLSVAIVNALRTRKLEHSDHQMFNFVEVFLTTTAQAIDMAVIKSKKRQDFLPEIIAETKLLETNYLANYLD
jgi:AcrR family transcriptional regulator